MRGFYDELGGPESIASQDEWGRSMTAAGLPASPGVNQGTKCFGEGTAAGLVLPDPPSESPSEDTLRHNFLLRRSLSDPGYGASRELSWREKAANGLGVPHVPPVSMRKYSPAGFSWVPPSYPLPSEHRLG